MRGPPPKPTELKILNGNPGKRPLPKFEPKPGGVAEMPAWLNAGAIVVWRELSPALEAVGLLTSADGEMFGVFCTLAAEFRQDSGKMSANRISRMDALSQRFGMDPSSRSRISVKPADPAADEARFFG